MFASILSAGSSKRNQVLSIDLGQRTTKAVYIQRRGDGYDLSQYALVDAPVFERAPSPDLIGAHLQTVVEALGYKGRRIAIILGVSDALLRQAELPVVPLSDMRLMLKYNSKNYLQQDLPDYIFDCHMLGLAGGTTAETTSKMQKARVLVGGTKKQTLDQLTEASKTAGLLLDQVIPSLICPANAFEYAMPDVFSNDISALVDIGFKSSSISIMANGELVLSRVVSIGSDKLTQGLAESMGVSYAEAEGIKVGLPEEVQGAMQTLIMPLGRELRASIDFFEHQQDKTVAHVFVSGGAARSSFLVETLQSELMVPTKAWNPLSFMNLALPPEKLGEVEQVAAQLAVAVGGALAVL